MNISKKLQQISGQTTTIPFLATSPLRNLILSPLLKCHEREGKKEGGGGGGCVWLCWMVVSVADVPGSACWVYSRRRSHCLFDQFWM